MIARTPELVARLQGLGTSVFTEIAALAVEHDAVNLGQGVPSGDPPPAVIEAAQRAIAEGRNQYPPGHGVAALRAAVAEHQRRFHGLTYDPDTEVTITFGATEAIAATLLALCEVGDEVIVLEPAYDAYTAGIAMAGAVAVPVPLRPPPIPPSSPVDGATPGSGIGGWTFDVERLAEAIGPRSRIVLINTPHNPTGTVLDDSTLDAIADLCVEHDLVAVTDEVYEHLVYEGRHVPLATRSGMRERTVTVSSAGKTFSCTGWKVGWACAPPALTSALRTTKQFLSFGGGAPLQHAIAVALASPDEVYLDVAQVHRRRRDVLVDGLLGLGLPVARSSATYFVTADIRSLGHHDAAAFCRWAPEAIGVAAVEVSAFVRDAETVRSIVRFGFCQPEPVLREGVRRLGRLATPRAPTRPEAPADDRSADDLVADDPLGGVSSVASVSPITSRSDDRS